MALIASDLALTADPEIDYDDEWSEEDLEDLRLHSLRYAETLYPDDDDLV